MLVGAAHIQQKLSGCICLHPWRRRWFGRNPSRHTADCWNSVMINGSFKMKPLFFLKQFTHSHATFDLFWITSDSYSSVSGVTCEPVRAGVSPSWASGGPGRFPLASAAWLVRSRQASHKELPCHSLTLSESFPPGFFWAYVKSLSWRRGDHKSA